MKIVETDNSVIEDVKEEHPLAIKEEDLHQLQVHLAEVDIKFGDGQDYNRDRIEGEIKTYAEQYRKSIFESGKRLILLKEHESHGEFLESLKRLDIDPRTAQRMMAATRIFIDERGNLKTTSMSLLPPTKLYALATLNDEDLDDFKENGEIEGFTLEEAKAMSTRDFKARIRELNAEKRKLEEQHRQEIEIKDQLLEDKNRKIDELDSKLRIQSDPAAWGEKGRDYLLKLQGFVPKASALTSEFIKLVSEIEGMEVKDWEQSQKILLEQAGYAMEQFKRDIEIMDDKLDKLVPEGNRIFHQLNELKAPGSK